MAAVSTRRAVTTVWACYFWTTGERLQIIILPFVNLIVNDNDKNMSLVGHESNRHGGVHAMATRWMAACGHPDSLARRRPRAAASGSPSGCTTVCRTVLGWAQEIDVSGEQLYIATLLIPAKVLLLSE